MMASIGKSRTALKKAQAISAKKPQRFLLSHLRVDLVTRGSPERSGVEQFITRHFFESHKAEIDAFLPYILTLRAKSNITSTVGFRAGNSSEEFFLEQYLNEDVETTLGDLIREPIRRQKLVEIGNLTSIYPGGSRVLFVLIVTVLYQAGFEWALFTAIPSVQRTMKKLGIVSHEICEANPNCLDANGNNWGDYYKNRPKVIVGNLRDAFHQLQSHAASNFMMRSHEQATNEIVKEVS